MQGKHGSLALNYLTSIPPVELSNVGMSSVNDEDSVAGGVGGYGVCKNLADLASITPD